MAEKIFVARLSGTMASVYGDENDARDGLEHPGSRKSRRPFQFGTALVASTNLVPISIRTQEISRESEVRSVRGSRDYVGGWKNWLWCRRPSLRSFKRFGAGPDVVIPRISQGDESISRRDFVSRQNGHVSKTVHLQIRSAVESLQVAIALRDPWPRHLCERVHLSVALACQHAGYLKVNDRAVWLSKTLRYFFSEGLYLAYFAIPLG